jgi:hypothetical protein
VPISRACRTLAIPRPAAAPAPHAYARREPENTVLHIVVREHLEGFLSIFREQHGKKLIDERAAEDRSNLYGER